MLGVCTVCQNINKNLWSCIEETGGEGSVWIYLAVNKVPRQFYFLLLYEHGGGFK